MASREQMRPTEALREEHRVIERGLRALEKAAERLHKGHAVREEVLEKLVDFIRGFADQCHHQKEEGILFPTLEGKGLPRDQGPIGVMLAEHDAGRQRVRGMAEAIERADPQAFVAHAQGYIALLRDHIAKEDAVLFPMAEQMLSPEDMEGMMEAFEGAEEEQGERHGRYLDLVQELEGALGLH